MNCLLGLCLSLGLLMLAGCGGTQTGDTEVWTIVRPDGAQARVTILGGAIMSDGMPQWTVLDNSGACSFPTPISGQMSGSAFDFTVTGGGCGGYMVQGTAMGSANGPFGQATEASGNISESVQTPGGPTTLNGAFQALRVSGSGGNNPMDLGTAADPPGTVAVTVNACNPGTSCSKNELDLDSGTLGDSCNNPATDLNYYNGMFLTTFCSQSHGASVVDVGPVTDLAAVQVPPSGFGTSATVAAGHGYAVRSNGGMIYRLYVVAFVGTPPTGAQIKYVTP